MNGFLVKPVISNYQVIYNYSTILCTNLALFYPCLPWHSRPTGLGSTRQMPTLHGEWPENQILIPNWTYLLQASPLTVLLFAPYLQPCGASDKEQKKALV